MVTVNVTPNFDMGVESTFSSLVIPYGLPMCFARPAIASATLSNGVWIALSRMYALVPNVTVSNGSVVPSPTPPAEEA